MDKPHLRYNLAPEETTGIKKRQGGGSDDKDKSISKSPNYRNQSTGLLKSYATAKSMIEFRSKSRSHRFEGQFDLLILTFYDAFNTNYTAFYRNFGLTVLDIFDLNRQVLFAIDNATLFSSFGDAFTAFYKNAHGDGSAHYSPNLRFIKDIRGYTTADVITDSKQNLGAQFLEIVEGDINLAARTVQINEIKDFLDDHIIEYYVGEDNESLYLPDSSDQLIKEITSNFDIIRASCASIPKRIKVGQLGRPIKESSYAIEALEDAPVIGVLDSGFSTNTPLETVLLRPGNPAYDLTSKGLFVDELEHGTGVAVLASVGRSIVPNYDGHYEGFQILPIKIVHKDGDNINPYDIIYAMLSAHIEHGVKIFTLSVLFEHPLMDNDRRSIYAYQIDKFLAQHDILLFIATGNNATRHAYPQVFGLESANVVSPAESINSITVGALADNLDPSSTPNQAISKDAPAIYSRTGHIDFNDSFFNHSGIRNRHLKCPDILMPGGDGCRDNDPTGADMNIAIDDSKYSAIPSSGTSYAAPLAANLAARLLHKYPGLTTLSIKSLLINAGNLPTSVKANEFSEMNQYSLDRIYGYGEVSEDYLFGSDDNCVTLLQDGKIKVGQTKLWTLKLPTHLNAAVRETNILTVTATLCYKVSPIKHNSLAYCPIHMSFAIGKNYPMMDEEKELMMMKGKKVLMEDYEGYFGNSKKNIRIAEGSGWADDYYYLKKMSSNVQKCSFKITKAKLIAEDNTVKIVVFAAPHGSLSEQDKVKIANKELDYSLTLRLEQQENKGHTLPSLYNQIILDNDLTLLSDLDTTLDVELDL